MASSKSRACSPSMVTMSQPRKSVRPARSAGVTAWSRPRAWATASGACSSAMPCLRSTISVSTPGSSSRPSTSTTRPGGHPGRTGPALDLDGDHVAVGCRQGVARGHLHLGVEPGVERHDHRAAALEPDLADDLGAAPLEDLQHPALGRGRRRGAARFAPARDRRASRRRGRSRGRRRRRLPATSGSTNANPPAWPCSRPVISSRRSGSARRRPPITTRRPSATRPFRSRRNDARSLDAMPRRVASARAVSGGPGWLRTAARIESGSVTMGVGGGRRRQAYQAGEISSTCRSPTLVPVGPGCQRSPSCAKYA